MRVSFLLLACVAPLSNTHAADAPPPRSRAAVEAILARAPKVSAESVRPLNVVLVADKKDHGPGEHDYPLWQQRWRVLLGGPAPGDSSAQQVNLFGPANQSDGPAALSDRPTTLPSPACGRGAGGEGGQRPNLGVDARRPRSSAPGVTVSTAWKWPSDAQFHTADLIVMFCYRSGGAPRAWNEAQVKQLETLLARGGGFVPIHSATYSLGDLRSPAGKPVVAATGLVFDKGIQVRHGPMTLKIADPSHPICCGLPKAIEIVDEPYWPPLGNQQATAALAVSDEAVAKDSPQRQPQPMFWTYQRGKGRVFGCVPGHFNWTFDDPLFRILLLRGMAWAAGESPYRFDPLVLRGARVTD